MRAVLLKDFKSSTLAVEEIPTPQPASKQVLIKMAAAPVNPSDLVFLRDQYGIKKKLPVVPGFEGSGTVIAAGRGFYAKWLIGKRVACHAPEDGNGTWAEYMVAGAANCVPLIKEVTFDQGASLVVNPFTAWALLGMAGDQRNTGFVQTAAASALGQMIGRLAQRRGMTAIHIVRRREHVELLKKAGAVYVLDSSEQGFVEQLHVLCAKQEIRLAFDAVGGPLTGQVAMAMPKGSRVIVYGALGGENCQMSPSSLIFEDKKLEGFWLTEWIKSQSFLKKMRMAFGVQKLLSRELATRVQGKFSLEQVQEAMALYKQKRTEGKVLLVP